MNEENKSYNILSKLIHWVMALLILGLLFLGFYMDSVETSDYKYWLYAQHKSLGVLVVALVILRIIWHIIKRKPKHLGSHKKWEKIISGSTHILLYIAMFAVPLSGWAMSSSGGYAVNLFGLELPAIVQKDKAMFELFGEAHEISAFALFFLIGLHMLGAFKHHFIDKDDTLKRMTAKSLGLVGGIIVLLLAVAAYVPAGFYVAEEVIEEIAEDDDDDENEKDHDDDDHGH